MCWPARARVRPQTRKQRDDAALSQSTLHGISSVAERAHTWCAATSRRSRESARCGRSWRSPPRSSRPRTQSCRGRGPEGGGWARGESLPETRRQWERAGQQAASLAATAGEAHGKGSVGKGSVWARKAVKTQGKGSVLARKAGGRSAAVGRGTKEMTQPCLLDQRAISLVACHLFGCRTHRDALALEVRAVGRDVLISDRVLHAAGPRSESMHQTWTAPQQDGPNHLGLWLIRSVTIAV